MTEEKLNKGKLCMFFASDYHFEMISIPFMKENMDNNKKIVVITENNLNESVQKVLSRINLGEEEKNKIKSVDWNNNSKEKIKNIVKEDTNIIVFIKGKKDYIKEINDDVKRIKENSNIEIIDCYDINEVGDEVKIISKEYDKILSTSGIEKLLK